MLQRVKILNTSKKEEELFEDYQIQYIIINEDFLAEHHPASVVASGNPTCIHKAPMKVTMETSSSPGGVHGKTEAFLPQEVPEVNPPSTDSGVCAGTTNVTTGNMADSSTLITTRGGTKPTTVENTSSQSCCDPIPDPVTQEMPIMDSQQTPPTSPGIPPERCIDNSSWDNTYDIKMFEYHADNWEFPWDVYASPMAEDPSNILSPPLHSPVAEDPSNILSRPLHSPSLDTRQDPTQQLEPLLRIDLQIPWFMKSHVERDKDEDHEIVSPVEESGSHFPCPHHDFIQLVAGKIPCDIIPPVHHPPLPLDQLLHDFLSDGEVCVQPVEDSGSQLSTSPVFPAPPWH